MPCTSALSMRAGHLDHRVSGEVWPRVAPRRKFGIRRCCCDWSKVGPGLAASRAAHVLAEKEQDLGCIKNYRREQAKMCIGADTRMSLVRCRCRPVISASSTQPSSILTNEGKTVEPRAPPPPRGEIICMRRGLFSRLCSRTEFGRMTSFPRFPPLRLIMSCCLSTSTDNRDIT
jgi:hypothetical protein